MLPDVDTNWQQYLDDIAREGAPPPAPGAAGAAMPLAFSSDAERRNAEIQINAAFFACLAGLLAAGRTAIVLIDHYDEASPEAKTWICEQLLASLVSDEKLRDLVVVLGGHDITLPDELQKVFPKRVLPPFENPDISEYWLNRRRAPVPPGLTPDSLPAALAVVGGNIPGELAKMADRALAQSQKDDPFFAGG